MISPNKIDLARNYANSQTSNTTQQPQTTTTSSGGYTSCTFLCNIYTLNSITDVKILQTILAKDPSVYPEALITGTLGPKTKQAIQRFQLKHSITASTSPAYGTVGPATRAKLESIYKPQTTTNNIQPTIKPQTTEAKTTNTPQPTTKPQTSTIPSTTTLSRRLSLGSTGPDVSLLQTLLTKHGYTTPITGTFDETTRLSLSKFQKDNNILPAEGSMGAVTAKRLGER
jgi:peptidoglycan hydrolase-like protein with peptidoglycan-binding domain